MRVRTQESKAEYESNLKRHGIGDWEKWERGTEEERELLIIFRAYVPLCGD